MLTVRDLWEKKATITKISFCFDRSCGYKKKRANVAVLAVTVCDQDSADIHFVQQQLGTAISPFTF